MKKEIWLDCRNGYIEENIQNILLQYSNVKFVIKIEDIEKFIKVKKQCIISVSNLEAIDKIEKDSLIMLYDDNDHNNLLDKIKYRKAHYINVNNYDSMIKAASYYDEYTVIKCEHLTNIPFELILAQNSSRETKIIKCVNSVEEFDVCFGVMEKGIDGVMIDAEQIKLVINYLKKTVDEKKELCTGKIIGISHVGMGTRVCIDTIDRLQKTEGCIIGSTSVGGMLISSETHFLPYMNLRPFRVNAGALHSYVMSDENKTSYLSELKSGDKIKIIDVNGKVREVSIGRCKSERRPMLKIDIECKGNIINSVVQDDWHIRVFRDNKTVTSVRELSIGDKVIVGLFGGPRHVGIGIEETLNEQ